MGLDTVELILEAEKHFGVAIPNARAAQTETVAQLAGLICELPSATGSPLSFDDALLQVQQLTARMFGIPIARVVPEARFVADLRLD